MMNMEIQKQMIMKIHYIKHLFVATICMMAFAACSNDDTQTGKSDEGYPIRLSHNLASLSADVTRASGSYTHGFLSGSTFWVWADMTDEGESNPAYRVKEYVSAWNLTVNSLNENTFDAIKKHSFPVYNKLSIYALHGNFTNTLVEETSPFPGMLLHVVRMDQKSDNDYLASDLVYAVKPDVVPQTEVVPLEFYHLLSKVEVVLKPGNGITAEEMKQVNDTKVTVTLVGTKTRVQFRPSKTVAETIGTEAGRKSMLTVVEDSESPITLSTVTTDDFTNGACAAAIVVPQTVNGHFVCINYMGYDTYYDVKNLELKSGYRYRFNLTVNRIGGEYVINPVSVAEWSSEPAERVAELE